VIVVSPFSGLTWYPDWESTFQAQFETLYLETLLPTSTRPTLWASLGTPPPATFDYRTADPAFSAYGWDVVTDPARAAEFLQLENVSRDVGSKSTTVRADRAGRVSFSVHLSPAHQVEQHSLAWTTGAAEPTATRQVRLAAVACRAPHH
jgi:hypothetical protein